jgi:transglutaminase-like putative cysteine protease
MNIFPEIENLEEYLQASEIIDWHASEVASQAYDLVAGLESDIAKAKRLYQWVRDEIAHSVDAGHQIVTCLASEVLKHRTGLCLAKAHLLAAMLRSVGIPAGFCYQLLRLNESSPRMILHGLNAIFLASLGRWIRVDSRGNKNGIDAQFSVEGEQLAFSVNPEHGEYLCEKVFVRPLASVVNCLKSHSSVTAVLANLPNTLET